LGVIAGIAAGLALAAVAGARQSATAYGRWRKATAAPDAIVFGTQVGKHDTDYRGTGGDPADQTKRYEFGDPFLLDLNQTLRNSIEREGPGTPLRLQPKDFEVYRT